jgi:hypothetical protein
MSDAATTVDAAIAALGGTQAVIDRARTADDPQAENKKSAATVLVELALSEFRFGVAPDGETFAVPKRGPKVVSTLRGNRSSLRALLARQYFRRTQRAAPQQALADALLVIEGLAQETEPEQLHLRVADHLGARWLDLGDADGRAIRIEANGWEMVVEAPVLFKRTALMAALPVPERDGDLGELFGLVNVSPDDRPLLAAWLVSTLYPSIAHPVLTFLGEQGTGKSSAARMIVQIADASPVPLRKAARDADSWVTAAAGSWLVGLDNLSSIPDWLSDSICRAVTGDGDVRRKLYTDGEHAVFAFRRCVLLNGIDLGALRGDLAERLLHIELDRIPDDRRRLEAAIQEAFVKSHARILGAVLDLAASVARVLPSVALGSSPRMADFARIVAAVDAVLGTDGLKQYMQKQGALAADSLSGDPFVEAIRVQFPNGFTGTSAELLSAITPDRAPAGWPANARATTARLRRQAASMRKAGWTVEHDGGASHANVMRWTVKPPEIACKPSSQPSQSSRGPSNPTPAASVASVASIDYGPTQDEEAW